MFSCYLFNNKKGNFIELFFKHLPKLTFCSTILGFAFLWVYLNNIERLAVFTEINFSAYSVFFIVFFFFIFFTCFFVNFSFIFIVLPFKGGLPKFSFSRRLIYAINQPMFISSFLSILLIRGYGDLNEESKIITIMLSIISIILITLSTFLYIKYKKYKKCLLEFLILNAFSLGNALTFVVILNLMDRTVEGDNALFTLMIIYITLLGLSNFIILSIKRSYSSFVIPVALCLLFILSIPVVGSTFKLQRIILKPIGIVQDASQSAWYFVKNKDFLNYMVRNYSIKYQKNIDNSENYIYGYLILNAGNVRVICPDKLEDDNKHKSKEGDNNHQDKIDFSKCLTLTSEDIKFMGKKAPFGEPSR
ncbi:hypothetical protein [Aggregatibacter aphrophilus]|uniref:Uncharacterized protein n=2 Tax=Aggregatibacter aphrophilus TaxID=732 RepID=A0AAP7GW79_AGGAP|nr:hypothetical protein [Aggregatibacter aphrophilus]OBY49789.1 hypothetical protein BBB52_10070 [Aggregatibacter aphrophilus]